MSNHWRVDGYGCSIQLLLFDAKDVLIHKWSKRYDKETSKKVIAHDSQRNQTWDPKWKRKQTLCTVLDGMTDIP